MKLLLLGVAITLALLLGVGIGYYLPGRSTTTASHLDPSQEIRSACSYLVANYNESLVLIAETPSHTRYFLYSDNYLVTLVLPKDCNNPSLANNIAIREALSVITTAKIPNQYMALECLWHFNASKDYDLKGPIWTTVNNQSGLLSPNEYADVAFLQAYYDAMCSHNSSGALSLFEMGAQLYNGTGFIDQPFLTGSAGGVFQTYKLALYVYTARLLDQTVPLSALVNLARMQAPSGGFYTGYDANFSNDGTLTNTETTCLAILALEAISTSSTTSTFTYLDYVALATAVIAILAAAALTLRGRKP